MLKEIKNRILCLEESTGTRQLQMRRALNSLIGGEKRKRESEGRHEGRLMKVARRNRLQQAVTYARSPYAYLDSFVDFDFDYDGFFELEAQRCS